MTELVSIIIPCFNVEKTIDRCMNSVINQYYKNIEIIVVNDGSTDNTIDLLNKYRKDNRVKIISQVNSGLSGARNTGIELAKGDYIMFVDSDDYISLSMVQLLVYHAKKDKADIVICGFENVNNNDNIDIAKDVDCSQSIVCTSKQALQNINKDEVEYNYYGVESWNKLYKINLFETIRFPLGKLYEDNFKMHLLINEATTVSYIKNKLYFYVKTENSITNSKYSEKKFEGLKGFELRIRFFSDNYPELMNLAIRKYLLVLISHYFMASKSNKTILKKKIRLKYKNYFNQYLFKDSNLKEKIILVLFRYFPELLYLTKGKDR